MGTEVPTPRYFLELTLKECQRQEADTNHCPSLDRAHTDPEAGEDVTALKTGKTGVIINLRNLVPVIDCRTIFIVWNFMWEKPGWVLEGNDAVITTCVRHHCCA